MIFVNKSEGGGTFRAFVPLETDKDGKVIIFEKSVKDGDGKEKKVKFLKGEASNTNIDKALERVSPDFLKKMKDTVKGKNVFIEHEHHLTKTVGYISETGGSENSFIAETALENEDENPLVKTLIDKIKHGTKIFYSIAGSITKASKQTVENIGEVTELLDGEIYELSFTALPEGNVGFVEPIMKSFKALLKNKEMISDEELTEITEDIMKTLDEMIQRSGLESDVSDLFWSFRSAVSRITYDSDLSPTKKKDKIISLSSEYGEKVEEISVDIAELTETIETELSA